MKTLERTHQRHHGGQAPVTLHDRTQSPGIYAQNVRSVNHLVLRVQAVYDTVFENSTITTIQGLGSSQTVRIPQSYTSLAEKLPSIYATAQWSETVIKAMFDTLIPLAPEYQHNYGSPIDAIVRIVENERKLQKKELAFGLLLAELEELEQLLPDLDLLEQHKQNIRVAFLRIRAIKN